MTSIPQPGDTPLACPSCGFDYLHHDGVTIYSRPEEDGAASCVSVDVPRIGNYDPDSDSLIPTAQQEVPPNPSERRSGLVIEGWCEGCAVRWQMLVAQHKGGTYVKVIPQQGKPRAGGRL